MLSLYLNIQDDSSQEQQSKDELPSPFLRRDSSQSSPLPFPQSSSSSSAVFVSQTNIDHCSFQILSRGAPELPVTLRNWNSEYQSLMEIPIKSTRDQIIRDQATSALIRDFADFAEKIVDFITFELILPENYRRIRPIKDFKSAIGGSRFVYGNCFIKLLGFPKSEPDRSYLASKIASNELRAYNALMRCHVPGLHLPLSTIVYSRGMCAIVNAFAPIGKSDTLIYGTTNGSKYVYVENFQLEDIISLIASFFNLKKRVDSNKKKSILPRDAEIHLSKIDGRLYLIDGQSLLPPSESDEDFIYKKFRPEFLRGYCKDIEMASDAFSEHALEDLSEDSAFLLLANKRMLELVIPSLVKDLESLIHSKISEKCFISETLHSKGICIRDIRLLFSFPISEALKERLAFEMICRVKKNRLRLVFRNVVMVNQTSLLILASRFLSDIFGRSKNSSKYWSFIVPHDVYEKFKVQLPLEFLNSIRIKMIKNENEYAVMLLFHLGMSLVDSKTIKELIESIRIANESDHDKIFDGIVLKSKVKTIQIIEPLKFAETERMIIANLENREAAFGKHSTRLIFLLNCLLDVYESFGLRNTPKAQNILDRIIAITKSQLSKKPDEALSRYEHGAALLQYARKLCSSGELKLASEYLNQVLILLETVSLRKAHSAYLKSLRKLGVIRIQEGNLSEADEILKRSMDFAVNNFGEDSIEASLSHNRIGWLYTTLDLHYESLPHFEKVYKICSSSESQFVDPLRKIKACLILARTYSELMNLNPEFSNLYREKYDSLLQESFSYHQVIMQDNMKLKQAECLNCLAGLYAGSNQLDKASELYDWILSIREQSLGPNNESVAWTINSQALLYFKRYKLYSDQSLELRKSALLHSLSLHEKAFSILEKYCTVYISTRAWTRYAISKCLFYLYKITPDCEFLDRAYQLLESGISLQYQITSQPCPRLVQMHFLLSEIESIRSPTSSSIQSHASRAQSMLTQIHWLQTLEK
jgi:tetratricopeptide (TPR) repeat protein